MSEQKEQTKSPYKTHYYQIVLRALRAGGVTLQSSGTLIFAIVHLPKMVFRGYEYVQPCLYGRKTAKEALFGGIQYYQVSLPHNPIVRRVFINWRKQNPIDPKHKMKNEVLWIYPSKFTGLQQLIEAWPIEEKERRIQAAEEEEYYANHWEEIDEDDEAYYDEDDEDDGYYWENM